MTLLLSIPFVIEHYPRVGFTKEENSFIINRKSEYLTLTKTTD
jgi:hypothetical protein